MKGLKIGPRVIIKGTIYILALSNWQRVRVGIWINGSDWDLGRPFARFLFLSSQSLSLLLSLLLLLPFSLPLSPISSNTTTAPQRNRNSAMSLRPGSRAEVRKKGYKIGVDAEEARRRREDNLVEIRKSKREDNLLKKRREGLPNGTFPQQTPLFPPDPSQFPAAVEKKVCFRFFF